MSSKKFFCILYRKTALHQAPQKCLIVDRLSIVHRIHRRLYRTVETIGVGFVVAPNLLFHELVRYAAPQQRRL